MNSKESASTRISKKYATDQRCMRRRTVKIGTKSFPDIAIKKITRFQKKWYSERNSDRSVEQNEDIMDIYETCRRLGMKIFQIFCVKQILCRFLGLSKKSLRLRLIEHHDWKLRRSYPTFSDTQEVEKHKTSNHCDHDYLLTTKSVVKSNDKDKADSFVESWKVINQFKLKWKNPQLHGCSEQNEDILNIIEKLIKNKASIHVVQVKCLLATFLGIKKVTLEKRLMNCCAKNETQNCEIIAEKNKQNDHLFQVPIKQEIEESDNVLFAISEEIDETIENFTPSKQSVTSNSHPILLQLICCNRNFTNLSDLTTHRNSVHKLQIKTEPDFVTSHENEVTKVKEEMIDESDISEFDSLT